MTDSSLSIERATRDDLPAVRSLAEIIWHRHYPGIVTEAQIDYMLERGYSPSALTAFIAEEGAGLLLARDNGSLIGFGAYYATDDMTEMKVDKLYLLPEYHGKGVGHAILEHIGEIARAAGFTTLILNVNKQNKVALRAYERNGFRIREAVVNDIGNGFMMDDFVMEKTLPSITAGAPDSA
jgi:GNAT superfamily N-acetyltransferase